MASGIPLTDEDRWPWLEAIGERMEVERVTGHGVVVSCSALKHAYRDCLRKKVDGKVYFILLDGSRELITDRMKKRKGHFMPPALLDSQFATLEKPTADEHAVVLDISRTVPTLLAEAAQSVGA
jgi:gluconokinase